MLAARAPQAKIKEINSVDPDRLLPSGTCRLCPHSLSLRYPNIYQRTTWPVSTSPNKDCLHQTTPAGTHRSDENLLWAPSVGLSNHQVVIAYPPLGHYHVNFYLSEQCRYKSTRQMPKQEMLHKIFLLNKPSTPQCWGVCHWQVCLFQSQYFGLYWHKRYSSSRRPVSGPRLVNHLPLRLCYCHYWLSISATRKVWWLAISFLTMAPTTPFLKINRNWLPFCFSFSVPPFCIWYRIWLIMYTGISWKDLKTFAFWL